MTLVANHWELQLEFYTRFPYRFFTNLPLPLPCWGLNPGPQVNVLPPHCILSPRPVALFLTLSMSGEALPDTSSESALL